MHALTYQLRTHSSSSFFSFLEWGQPSNELNNSAQAGRIHELMKGTSELCRGFPPTRIYRSARYTERE